MSSHVKIGNVYYLRWREYVPQKDGTVKEVPKKKAISYDWQTFNDYKERFDLNRSRTKLGLPVSTLPWQEYCAMFLKNSATVNEEETVARDELTVRTFNEMVHLQTIEQFGNPVVIDYRQKRIAEGRAPSTVNREVTTLRAMGKFMMQMNYHERNPIHDLPDLKEANTIKTRVLTPEEFVKFRESFTEPFRTAVYLAGYTGMRRKEIAKMTLAQLDLKAETMNIIQTKTNKQFDVPMHPTLAAHLRKVVRGKRERILEYEHNRHHSGHVDLDVLSTTITRGAQALGLTDVTMHTLRHTFVTHLRRAGVDRDIVARLVGHANQHRHQTDEYTHLRMDDLRAILLKLPY